MVSTFLGTDLCFNLFLTGGLQYDELLISQHQLFQVALGLGSRPQRRPKPATPALTWLRSPESPFQGPSQHPRADSKRMSTWMSAKSGTLSTLHSQVTW